jgi:hypothetical protein
MPTSRDSLQAAREYRASGWWPIPLPRRSKAPTIDEWPTLRIDGADLEAKFDQSCNIGVILGGPSGGLTDVDLDAPEALQLADYFLPNTGAVFGRPSKPRSHRLYIAEGAQTIRFKAPDGTTLVEIRSTGCQTVFPPSVHPSGEGVAWESNCEPAEINCTGLNSAVAKLAAASLIVHRYPGRGGRHDFVLALSGALLRNGWTEDDTRHFVEAIARVAGDEEARARLADIKTTARRLANDRRATGWPTLAQMFGEKETNLVRQWLGLREEQATIEWTEPIPLDNPQLPPLPNDIFPSWLNCMVEAVAEATETPRELGALTGLGVVAAAVQKKFIAVVPRGHSEPLNVWANVVLDSGNRKTAVLSRMTEPLLQWEREQAAAIRQEAAEAQSRRATAEARISELRKHAARAKAEDFEDISRQIMQLESQLPEIPRVPRFWTQDVTPEKLGALMAEQLERMAIISDEGGIFDILAGRYNNGIPNLDLFLQSHAGSPVRVDRGSRSAVVMANPALTMALTIQPDVLNGLASKQEFRGRGLLARCLYMLPVSRLGYRRGDTAAVPADVASQYERGIRALLAFQVTEPPIAIELSPEAYRAWLAFSRTVECELRDGARFEHIRDWAGKLPGAAARIAGLLHCAEYAFSNPGVVTLSAATMEHALQFAAVLSEHALAVFDLMGADAALKAARKVWSWIVRNRKPQFTFRDAHQGLRGSFPRAADLRPAFEVLVERSHIREIVRAQHRGGRPSERFEVHPIFAAWDDRGSESTEKHTQNTQKAADGSGFGQTRGGFEDFEDESSRPESEAALIGRLCDRPGSHRRFDTARYPADTRAAESDGRVEVQAD